MYYGLYQLLGWLLFVIGIPVLFCYVVVVGKGQCLWQRLGFTGLPRQGGESPRVWIHGSSVGEMQVAKALINELRKRLPAVQIFVSTMTEQGQAMARQQLGPDIRCLYAPLDLLGVVGRVVNRIRPDLYICLETELWPNLLNALNKSGCGLALLNGRMSARSYRRYRLVRGFMRRVLANFSVISMISIDDAERYLGLGASPEKIHVLGNAKYDLAGKNLSAETEKKYRELLKLAEDQPLLVAGSTHSGEEQLLLDVFQELQLIPGLKDLVFVVAPRHLSRLDEVQELLRARGCGYDIWSSLKRRERRQQIVLVDQIGELVGIYTAATYVFCGGSLVDRGGHNVLEAAVHGRPVFFGSSMSDFAEAAELLLAAGAAARVSGPTELVETIRYFHERPDEYAAACQKARETALTQQGSVQKQVALVMPFLTGQGKKGVNDKSSCQAAMP